MISPPGKLVDGRQEFGRMVEVISESSAQILTGRMHGFSSEIRRAFEAPR